MEVCLIFDIGKTNKKALVFNKAYEVLWQETVTFEEVLDDDGEHCDDLMGIVNWLKSTYKKVSAMDTFSIKAVNFSCYGASLVHVDKDGKNLSPIYNYLKVFPKKTKTEFLAKYNTDKDFFQLTASPDLGMLNSGLQAYWLKYNKTSVFKNVKYSLHFPQYVSSLFHGKFVADITSVGCHTGIWNFHQNGYHRWLEDEKMKTLSLEVLPANTFYLHDGIAVGIGIHDSSAALVPYIKGISEPFILISTGTWSISMNPFNAEPLKAKELSQDCLQYLTFEGKPVKSARVFTGNEHDRHVKHLATYFEKPVDYYKNLKFNAEIIKNLRKKQHQAIPSQTHLSGLIESPFVERNLNVFENYEQAYHQLMIDLICQQVASTNLVLGETPIKKIIVEGGFANNAIFMTLLNEAFFNYKVYRASLAQGSALGAAMVISQAWGAVEFTEKDLELIKV
jgi:L-fuculokinase